MSSSSYSQGVNKNTTGTRSSTRGSPHGIISDGELPLFLKDVDKLIIQFTAEKKHTIDQNDFFNELSINKKDGSARYANNSPSFKKYLVSKARDLELQFQVGKVKGDGNCFWYCLAELLGLTVSFLQIDIQ